MKPYKTDICWGAELSFSLDWWNFCFFLFFFLFFLWKQDQHAKVQHHNPIKRRKVRIIFFLFLGLMIVLLDVLSYLTWLLSYIWSYLELQCSNPLHLFFNTSHKFLPGKVTSIEEGRIGFGIEWGEKWWVASV